MMKWGEQERDRKEKGNTANLPKPNMNSKVSNETQELGGRKKEWVHLEDVGRLEN